jgi:hypothetical protein
MSNLQPLPNPNDQDPLISDNSSLALSNDPSPSTCVSCKAKPALVGYPTALCSDCRRHFIRFPIPLWIRIFGVAVLLIVLFACVFLPRQLSTGIHKARGEKAESEHRYLTAYKEFKLAEKGLPDNTELRAHLVITGIYNENDDDIHKYGRLITDKSLDNEDLNRDLNKASEVLDYYILSEQMKDLNERFPDGIPDTAFQHALDKHPDDYIVQYYWAMNLDLKEDLPGAAKAASTILYKNPMDVPALKLADQVAVERKLYDSALDYCDRMLALNQENLFALSGKARNLLRLGRVKEAEGPAETGYKLDDTSAYTVGTMALLYHCQKQDAKARPLIQQLQKDHNPDDSAKVNYVLGVINGTRSL